MRRKIAEEEEEEEEEKMPLVSALLTLRAEEASE